MITDQTGIGGETVSAVIAGYQNQIRKLPEVFAKTELIKILPFVAEQYGGRKEIPPHVQAECVRLVLSKFSFIGISEIREAYRMWASSEIKVEGADMYGGFFNAAQLGKILTAYCEQRKKVVAQYSKLKQKEQERTENELRVQRMRDQYEAQFFDLIIEAKTKYTDFRDLPIHWYDTLLKKEMIIPFYEMDANEFQKCFQLAKMDSGSEGQESKSIFKKVGEKDNQRLENRSKVYAQKKLLFDFIQGYQV